MIDDHNILPDAKEIQRELQEYSDLRDQKRKRLFDMIDKVVRGVARNTDNQPVLSIVIDYPTIISVMQMNFLNTTTPDDRPDLRFLQADVNWLVSYVVMQDGGVSFLVTRSQNGDLEGLVGFANNALVEEVRAHFESIKANPDGPFHAATLVHFSAIPLADFPVGSVLQ